MAKVIQADRDCAGACARYFEHNFTAVEIETGEADNCLLVETVTEFREASTTQLLAERDELVAALQAADNAMAEMLRYYDGGETRGSYDGKPERAQLRKAYNTTRVTLVRIQGQGEYTCGGGE